MWRENCMTIFKIFKRDFPKVLKNAHSCLLLSGTQLWDDVKRTCQLIKNIIDNFDCTQSTSAAGGRAYQLVGPRRALYAQLRKRQQLLRPCRALCPLHAYFRIDSACSHRQKTESPASFIRPTLEDTSCLGPAESYAPSAHISELIVLAHIGKKQESPWDGQPPSPARALI